MHKKCIFEKRNDFITLVAMKKKLLSCLLFCAVCITAIAAGPDNLHPLDTLPDGRSIYELNLEELKLFSDPQTRSFITGMETKEIRLDLFERLYLFGSMLTVSSPTLKMPTAVRVLPGLSRAETGIAQTANNIYHSNAFAAGIKEMKAGSNSEIIINGIKIVFQADAPFSGFTLFGENGFVIGKEALRSSDELLKTVLHECYRLATSSVKSKISIGQTTITQETQNVVNFVERAIKSLDYD